MNWLSIKEVEARLKETQNPEWIERALPVLKEAHRQWRHLHPKQASSSPMGKEMRKVNPSPYSKMFYGMKARPKVTFTGRETDAQNRQVCFRDGHHAPCEQFGGQNQGWTGVEQEHLQKEEGQKGLPPLPDQVSELKTPPKVKPSKYAEFFHGHKHLVKSAENPSASQPAQPKQPKPEEPKQQTTQQQPVPQAQSTQPSQQSPQIQQKPQSQQPIQPQAQGYVNPNVQQAPQPSVPQQQNLEAIQSMHQQGQRQNTQQVQQPLSTQQGQTGWTTQQILSGRTPNGQPYQPQIPQGVQEPQWQVNPQTGKQMGIDPETGQNISRERWLHDQDVIRRYEKKPTTPQEAEAAMNTSWAAYVARYGAQQAQQSWNDTANYLKQGMELAEKRPDGKIGVTFMDDPAKRSNKLASDTLKDKAEFVDKLRRIRKVAREVYGFDISYPEPERDGIGYSKIIPLQKSLPSVPASKYKGLFVKKALGGRKAPPAPGKYPSDLNVSKVTSNPLPPSHPPGEQPPPVPENSVQHGAPDEIALQQIERYIGERGQGTGLAHEIRAHQVDASILQQFQAHGVASLTDLSSFLRQQGVADSANLTEFHDDESPFVVLSQPQQQISGRNAPSVVVGKPYNSVIHLLEEAFPGVHFLPVEEAPKQLKEAAQGLPLPAARKYLGKSNSVQDNTNTKLPRMPSHQTQSTSKPGNAQQTPLQAPQVASQAVQPVQQAIQPPLAQTQSTAHPPQPVQQPAFSQQATNLAQTTPVPPQMGEQPLAVTQDYPGVPPLPQIQGQGRPPEYLGFKTAEEYAEKAASEMQKLLEAQGILPEQAAEQAFETYNQATDEWNQARWEGKGMNQAPLPQGETLSSLTTDIGRQLSVSKEVNRVKMKNGGNSAWNVEVEGGFRGVQKLGRDENFESENTTGIKNGTMYRREIAASSIERVLFGDKSNLIPETTLRLQNGTPGSIQSYIQGFKSALEINGKAAYGKNEESLQWAFVLDYLMANTDRHMNNFGTNEAGELVLIDNGLTLPSRRERLGAAFRIRSSNILAEGLVRDLKLPDLSHIKDKWAILSKIFNECGIEEEAIMMAKERWDNLITFQGRPCRMLPAMEGGNISIYDSYNEQTRRLRGR